ncbi:hypothetical protein N875_02140 [Neisseria meningitidis LNP21362]|nr:hypothetical protein N875_02140 [Neisseria meningitidis LNP21362]
MPSEAAFRRHLPAEYGRFRYNVGNFNPLEQKDDK